jgi:hypothetical protein
MPFLEPVDVTAEEWLTAVAEADGVFLPLAVTAEAFEKVAAEAMPFLPEEVRKQQCRLWPLLHSLTQQKRVIPKQYRSYRWTQEGLIPLLARGSVISEGDA